MHNLKSLPNHLLDGSVILSAVRAVLDLLACVLNPLSDRLPLMGIFSLPKQRDVVSSLVLVEQHSAALFADALEDVDHVLKVTHVVHREIELHIAKMTWAILEVFVAGVANFAFLAHTLKN